MLKSLSFRRILPAILAMCLLAGCSGTQTADNAPAAIEAYLQALVAKDANQMVNWACADYEAQARQELRSFDAEKMTLQDLRCQEQGQSNGYTLVECTGAIIASYGAEDLQIDLAGRPFKVIQEGGIWRMCGYQ